MKKQAGLQNVSVQIEDFIVDAIKQVKGRTMAEFIRRAVLARIKWVLEKGETDWEGKRKEPYFGGDLEEFRRELKRGIPVPVTGKSRRRKYR